MEQHPPKREEDLRAKDPDPCIPETQPVLVEGSVRGYAAVGLLATALAGIVGQAAFADTTVEPAATSERNSHETTAENVEVVRAHSHFGIAQLGEKAQSPSADQQPAGDNADQGQQRNAEAGQQNGDNGGQNANNNAGDNNNGGENAGNQGGGEQQQAQQAQPKPAPQPQFDQVDRWINRAIDVLQNHGVPVAHDQRDEIRTIIEKESSGDPRAINLWDSNAAKGIPSKGLMQTIDPTFDAYKLAGHNDIYAPVDNIIAGVNYTFDRYGGFEEHPGLKSMSGGGGYQGY
ncbi:transglycosylase SLT domain-containing protein [Saccharomonospora sp. CUA-673]|uniref:transglycosylase SLT domain-containing protein n=1 Tax=Saccharomonospora sp. CUA-673 TaxID=1904969 RepID=UPI0009F94E50